MREVRLLGSRAQVLRAEWPETRRERMRGWRGRWVGPDDVLLLDRAGSFSRGLGFATSSSAPSEPTFAPATGSV